ncbi:conserved hypothetical protein [Talaromyces stipitatus ATCC 10500]|uniref:DUF1772-domain-containing protein n=1 Tax=Talaromyces stipitatus (strain ATCC 10500 / CBS 375.48 / QM 6759 / NRRL 1006) TaxID=441959 RepID=B8MFD1_TALSN|nr:uncharacterized protein TSTA_017400 [Talaromyces stipitatus ATCC 10500]EED16665.1 conserved hypothetical protein [Talaromyces stipitatus ATCC 10500]
MADSILVKTAQISAILTAAAASGGILSLSIFTIPAIGLKHKEPKARITTNRSAITLGAPLSHIAHQWQFTYDLGKKVFPSMAVTSSLLYSYVAYALHSDRFGRRHGGWVFYLVAAGLNVMIAPFTLLAIAPVNNAIAPYTKGEHDLPAVEAAKQGGEVKFEKAERELVGHLEKWSFLNLIRGVFPLAGAGVGAAVSFGLLS